MLTISYFLLEQAKILQGANRDISITYFSKLLGIEDFFAAFPRWIPHNGSEGPMMNYLGFDNVGTTEAKMPSEINKELEGQFNELYTSPEIRVASARETSIIKTLNPNKDLDQQIRSLQSLFHDDIQKYLVFPSIERSKLVSLWQKQT
jgi:hypothetical protein